MRFVVRYGVVVFVASPGTGSAPSAASSAASPASSAGPWPHAARPSANAAAAAVIKKRMGLLLRSEVVMGLVLGLPSVASSTASAALSPASSISSPAFSAACSTGAFSLVSPSRVPSRRLTRASGINAAPSERFLCETGGEAAADADLRWGRVSDLRAAGSSIGTGEGTPRRYKASRGSDGSAQ